MDDKSALIIRDHVMNSLPVGLVFIDPNGDIGVVNAAACRILGYTQEDFRNKGWGRLFIDMEKNVEFNNVIIEVIRQERLDLRREVPYLRPDGEMRHLSLISSFLKDGKEILGIAIIIDDLTELHAMHTREKENLRERTRIQQERAQGLNKLALAVAHQVRNPMVAIGGFANLMLRKVGRDNPLAEYLDNIITAASRLESIVTAVRTYAAMSHGEYRHVQVDRVIHAAMTQVTDVLAKSGTHMDWRMSIVHHDIMGDAALIQEALYEIMLNAAESYEGREGVIEIETARTDAGVSIQVRDHGRGISPEDLPYIFDPFFTTKAVGVGMGLCKAARAANEHKGRLRVDSSGQGALATLTLPDDPLRDNGGDERNP